MPPLQPLRSLSLFLLLFFVISAAGSGTAHAKSSRKVSHAYEGVWPATVRFLRIDEGLTISEKDSDTGYILFVIEDEGKTFDASVEVIRRKDYSDRDAVELVLQIKKRPSYMEIRILDRLMLKLRKELGHPKAPPAKNTEKSPDSDKEPAKESGD